MLRIPYVIVHPGSYVEGTELQGLKRIVTAVNQVHRKSKGIAAQILLEPTAGQGTSLGCKFEHLRHVLENIRAPERVDVCLDTCHVFAAGYPLAPKKEYRDTMQEFNDLVGVGRIKAFHLNDSKKPFGSRVDRHEHIGRGHLGEEPFAHLLKDRRFIKVPMYLETPKGDEDGTDLDKINLATLRRLAGK